MASSPIYKYSAIILTNIPVYIKVPRIQKICQT